MLLSGVKTGLGAIVTGTFLPIDFFSVALDGTDDNCVWIWSEFTAETTVGTRNICPDGDDTITTLFKELIVEELIIDSDP